MGRDFAKEGITQRIPIVTTTPHSSVIKSLSLLGIGNSNIIQVFLLPYPVNIKLNSLL